MLLELAVGGAHNDTLVLAALAGALALTARRPAPRFRRAARWRWPRAIGVKVTAGLVLPFLVLAPASWRERARVALARVARPARARGASG